MQIRSKPLSLNIPTLSLSLHRRKVRLKHVPCCCCCITGAVKPSNGGGTRPLIDLFMIGLFFLFLSLAVSSSSDFSSFWTKINLLVFFLFIFFFLIGCCTGAERETRSEAKVGQPPAGQTAQRHHARMPGGFRLEHHGQEAGHVRPLQSRSKGQNEAHRLPQTSR